MGRSNPGRRVKENYQNDLDKITCNGAKKPFKKAAFFLECNQMQKAILFDENSKGC